MDMTLGEGEAPPGEAQSVQSVFFIRSWGVIAAWMRFKKHWSKKITICRFRVMRGYFERIND